MISIHQILAAWNRFFFQPESPLPMAVYRILLGLVALANQLLILPDVFMWYGERGSLARETARTLSGGAGLNLLKYMPETDTSAVVLFSLSIIFSITLAIGLFTRTSAALLFLSIVSLNHRNPLILNGGDTFLRVATFFVIFSQAGAALSVDRWLRLRRGIESGPPEPRAPWAMRLIQLQISFLYLYAFVWKALGLLWWNGTAVYYTSRLMEFWRFPMPYVFEHMWTIKLWSWGTLIIELALGTLIWVKELRYWVLLAGVLLHLGIDYSMNIPLFAFIMMAVYVTFVDPRDLEVVLAKLKALFARRAAPLSRPAPSAVAAAGKKGA